MRKQSIAVHATMIVALVLITSVAAMAADPIIGTWKLNIAKSRFPAGYSIQKEGTETYREIEGDQIEVTFGSGGKLIWPRQGGSAKISKGTFREGISYVETLMEPGNWYVTGIQNGRQTGVRHKTVSKDGKTMRQTVKSMDAQGKPMERLEVYDKQ